MALRLQLARFYGGPAYWLDPELDPLIVETAVDLMDHATNPEG